MKISNAITFGGTRINTIYYNDLHGQTKNIQGFLNVRDNLYFENPEEINLTLSGGDVFLDTSKHNEKVAESLVTKTDAIAIGNHDIECGEPYFKKLANKFGIWDKFLAANVSFEDSFLNENIQKSKVIEQNGTKIGLIGLSPLDFKKIAFITKENQNIQIADIHSTIESLKKEVKKLEQQGVNIIFLLAHTGEIGENDENYYDLFSKIGGIDVIIGGHDHKEVKRITYSERKEPVLIISTGNSNEHGFGENLDYFGLAKLEFDDNGVLLTNKSSNHFMKTPQSSTPSNKGNVVYTLEKPLKPSNALFGHSETANLIVDSNLWYVNNYTKGEKADFAILNPGTIRDSFDDKEITDEKILSTLPFTVSKLIKTKLTKQQIIETLTWGAKSTQFGKVSPGVMQVSRMEYTINPDLSISDIHILDEHGKIKYDLDNFDDDYEFPCVYDVFLATGVAGLSALKKETNAEDIEYFNVARQDVLPEYLTQCRNIWNYEQVRIHKE